MCWLNYGREEGECVIMIIFLLCILLSATTPIKYKLIIKNDGEEFFLKFIYGFLFRFQKDNYNQLIKVLGIKFNSKVKIHAEDIKTHPVNANEFDLHTIKNILLPTLELIQNVLAKLKPSKLNLTGKVGFDNPYLTGLFAAFKVNASVFDEVHCDFEQKVFNYKLDVVGYVSLSSLATIVLKYVMHEDVRKILKQAVL